MWEVLTRVILPATTAAAQPPCPAGQAAAPACVCPALAALGTVCCGALPPSMAQVVSRLEHIAATHAQLAALE